MKQYMAALVLTLVMSASSALAQYPNAPFAANPVVVSSGSGTWSNWSAVPPYNPQFGHYSYYVTAPNIARGYVAYGPSDTFPFYGQPYGRAYDAWTWDYMGSGMANRPRYFYPPVR